MKNRWISVVGMLVGIYLIAFGITKGEVNTVFSKAIRICLECIGIG